MARISTDTPAVLAILSGLFLLTAAPITSVFFATGEPDPKDESRLAEVNAAISNLERKFLEAQQRGVVIRPVPARYRDLEAERRLLLERVAAAEPGRQRVIVRLRWFSAVVMAFGVAIYYLRRRASCDEQQRAESNAVDS